MRNRRIASVATGCSVSLIAIAITAIVSLFGPRLAWGHTVGLSNGTYSVDGSTITLELVLARAELLGTVPEVDANKDGVLAAEELAQAKGALERVIVPGIRVLDRDTACPGALDAVQLTEEDGASIKAVYRCSRSPERVVIRLEL